MKKILIMLSLLILHSCGNAGQDVAFTQDPATTLVQGLDTPSVGVDFSDIEPGLACAAGGISIYSFYDSNINGLFEINEVIIKTKSICNGTNASISLEGIASSTACPSGGVRISSPSSIPVEVCNGSNGLNGAQGIQGVQGIPGITGATGAAGSPGTVVTPIKFCSTDNSTFPEYGLLIGNELYAIFWGPTPASPNTFQAYLSKLVAGNYMSTGGNNCLFSIDS